MQVLIIQEADDQNDVQDVRIIPEGMTPEEAYAIWLKNEAMVCQQSVDQVREFHKWMIAEPTVL